MPANGFVYLVGAGPGDPRLLTLRAYELLRSAEIVAHDELVTDAILALAPPEAERLAVGRRCGHGKASYRIHPAVLERARAGHTVVRLKCGDPLVFGRGGEEAEALADAKIPFEIVPGISAAVGAAAYAGIPLTHRERSSAVTLATGHDADEAPRPRGSSLVLYMATRRLAQNVSRLIAEGWPQATPAAYVASATTPDQRVVVGTLAELPHLARDVDPRAPALVIVGDVVALRERIAWFEHRPLRGRRVLVARARPGRSEIASQLRGFGAEVLELPEVGVARLDNETALATALATIAMYDGIVFGCAPAVAIVLARETLAGMRIIAVGREARVALEQAGIAPAIAVAGACREGLAAHADELRGRRLLLVTSERGRPSLRAALARLGATVAVVPAYRYVNRVPDGRLPPIDLVVLPSTSAARAVLGVGTGDVLRRVPVVAMGPGTEAEARKHGATRVARAPTDSVPSIVATALAELEGS
jgi:uroporphyrinogen III methyltransferase/synthase